MTKKELEQEYARMRKGLERICEIANNPRGYGEKTFPEWSGDEGYIASCGAISAIAKFALTGVIEL